MRISSPDCELWPDTGMTKLVLAECLVSVGGWFMPIAGHRSITFAALFLGCRPEELSPEPAARRPRGCADRHPDLPLGPEHPQLVLSELAVGGRGTAIGDLGLSE